MDPERLLALCHEHAGAEGQGDMTRVLATMVADPRYEFFPLRRGFSGRANTERFYADEYPRFAARVTGAQMVAEWTNEIAAAQEYVIVVAAADEEPPTTTTYHVLSMMPGDDASLLTGERLYCDEGFVRALLGSMFDLLEPLP